MLSPRVRALLSSSVLVALGLAVAQVLAYLLNVAAARLLGPQTYGALAALMSVLLITSTVALGLQAAIGRRVAAAGAEERPGLASSLTRATRLTALGLGALALAVSPLITGLLRLESWVPAALIALTIGVFTVGGSQLGIAQGGERFGRLGGLYASSQLFRTLGALGGAVIGGTLTGTLLGLLAGTVLGVVMGHWIVRALIAGPPAPVPGFAADAWHATHALLALFVLTNMDVILARVFLDPLEAGIYAVGVLVAKVAFFLPQFVIVIAFPAMARRQDRRSVLLAASVTAALGLAVTAVVVAFGPLVVAALGGSQYSELASEAWLFATVGALFAIAQVLLYGQVARGNRWAVAFLWAAVAIFAAAVSLGPHDSVLVIVSTALVVAVVVVVAGLVATARARPAAPLTLEELEEFLEP